TKSIVLEMPRSDCFSPVKNAEGVDSAETARRDMVRRASGWLEACGVKVPTDSQGNPQATIEISPLRAINAEQLRQSMDEAVTIKAGDRIYLD
ncbi:MAG: hypothetical protein GXP29_10075, partial [Planctomycetes bacterium]|nr:hypothetical protein [Planctomycetota bacterium]